MSGMEDSLAVLPASMGREDPSKKKTKPDPKKFIPAQRGGLLLSDPKQEECPYSFTDNPAYVQNKKLEDQAKRAAELEGKDETRGFLRNVEELGKKQRWEEALQILDRRTAVPSGLFLVTRAVLKWKFGRYHAALRDAEEALVGYSSSAKAGPLSAAFACFARICLGSAAGSKASCSKEMQGLVEAWEQAEHRALAQHVLGQGLFHPRAEDRLTEPAEIVEGYEASDGSYPAASGVRIGYVFLRNTKDTAAPLVLHFHGNNETAADYRRPALAQKYRAMGVHLLVADYRGYGWSGGEPSLATLLRDAEPLAEKLPELLIQHGFPWPYPGGIILSGRSLGAQVAIHVATLYPNLFHAMVLDSAVATSASGDRLGRAPERGAALARWRKELEAASLEVLQPLDAELWGLSALEKIRGYTGRLLVLHGSADEVVPFEGCETLHTAAAGTTQKELVRVEGAGHNDIGQFEKYWDAQRNFALKVQLDTTVPSVKESPEHLCGVCAAKAASKCGNCQKVWYCGRAHQAEHWKVHKKTCAGGPPKPKEPVVAPEGEACLVICIIATLQCEEDVQALRRCLTSACAQEHKLGALGVSWHGSSPALVEQAEAVLRDCRAAPNSPEMFTACAPHALQTFDHVRSLLGVLPPNIPSYTWVKILDRPTILSTKHASVLVPALRRAAPDQRVVAVQCLRRAEASVANSKSLPTSSAEMEAMLLLGEAHLLSIDEAEARIGDIAVRLKTLQVFVEQTRSAVLARVLCGHRFRHKLVNTFGKRMQVCTPPDNEWMRWSAPALPPRLAAPGAEVGECTQAGSEGLLLQEGLLLPGGFEPFREADRRRAEVLADGFRRATAARGEAAAADAAEAAAEQHAEGDLSAGSVAAATHAMATLRHRIERWLVVCGDEVSSKEVRATAAEEVHRLLEQVGLGHVIGLERWARETGDAIAREAAEEFGVKICATSAASPQG